MFKQLRQAISRLLDMPNDRAEQQPSLVTIHFQLIGMATDWKKDLKQFYFPSGKTVVDVLVPKMNFLMVDGEGNPNTSKTYQGAIMALYSMAYTLKFDLKKRDPSMDFRVGPLEGLWWNTDQGALVLGNKDDWRWTAMIMVPDFITLEMATAAKKAAAQKKDLPELPKLHMESYDEGRAAQIMYVGPYVDEGPTIERIHWFIQEMGGTLKGKHHEIYLSDPRRTLLEKLKTVIRQPFQQS